MRGYGITIIPFSWALGRWRKAHKTILAFGPIRLTAHYDLGEWRGIQLPNPRDRKK